MAINMISGMPELEENELQEACSELGAWHEVDNPEEKDLNKRKKKVYLVNKENCMTCLMDILGILNKDSEEKGFITHLKLGEWKVLPEHLIPLFAAYREDKELSNLVLKIFVHLTTPKKVNPQDIGKMVHCLQDYKEAFARKDIFIILMGMLVENFGDEETQQDESRDESESRDVFADIFKLLCNITSVPDPRPTDAGYTPMRKTLQLSYIRLFHDEGVFDFFQLFAEQLEQEKNADQIWSLLQILYHIVAQVDPAGTMQMEKDKDKKVLADLLKKDEAFARVNRTQMTRHSRFGSTLQRRDAVGGVSTSASMNQSGQASKGSKIYGQDFKNRQGSESKQNLYHDPLFVDLEEGSVCDHNKLNPHVPQSRDVSSDLSEAALTGLREFFEQFIQMSFSTMVGFVRGTVLQAPRPGERPLDSYQTYGRQHLLNFSSWILEFHRHHYSRLVAKAKEQKTAVPNIDIACIQGAIDLDMIQFVSSRLREYGKEANFHSSFLVLVLRCLCQQVKTIGVTMDSEDADTRTCGEVLATHIIREDVMAQLVWIMRNFKSSAHDPRILSYTIEVFHHMTRHMQKTTDRQCKDGPKKVMEFAVEKVSGTRVVRAAVTIDELVESLADANAVENLFHLLEKYKRHSTAMNSMLVKLIYTIVKARPCNIVIFFELSYFVRIHRMWSDPIVRDKKEGKKYQQMVELLRFILRQFFKCAETNKCVFVEILFRKTFAKKQDAITESHQTEFEAILDNYEAAEYQQVLDRMRSGESFDNMRARQKQLMEGTHPWTEDEDDVLKQRYHVFADHPMCLDLLVAELPDGCHRSAKAVKKRLQELNILQTKADRDAAAGNDGYPDMEMESPSKRQKISDEKEMDDLNMDMPDLDAEGADLESLEMDLERLMESEDSKRISDEAAAAEAAAAAAAEAAEAEDADIGLDLEAELEAMIDEGGPQSQMDDYFSQMSQQEASTPAAASAPAAPSQKEDPASSQKSGLNLEEDLAKMLEEDGVRTQPTPCKSQQTPPRTQPDTQCSEQKFWEDMDIPESADLDTQPAGSSPEVPATQAADSEVCADTLELDLEKMLDEAA